MSIAIVILNWNGKALLEQFLPSVIEHSKEATVYVADNASTDDSVAFVEKEFPSIKIIKNALILKFTLTANLNLLPFTLNIKISLFSTLQAGNRSFNSLTLFQLDFSTTLFHCLSQSSISLYFSQASRKVFFDITLII